MRWPQLPPRHSLQWRLGLGLAIGLAVLWLLGAAVAGLMLRGKIDAVFDSALQEVAQRILPLAYIEVLNSDTPATGPGPVQLVPAVGPHEEQLTYIVRDQQGRVLLQSHAADPALFPAQPRPGFQRVPGLRLYTEAAVQGTLVVTVAEHSWRRRAALRDAIWILLWPLAFVLPLSQLGAWALVHFALRPVRGFQADIEARGRGNLAPVHEAGLPSEISPVARSVNGLITRLRRALEAERGFTANSAHELRTPIAAALAHTQRLLAELAAGPPRDRARQVETALRQLSRLAEKLLQLAKAEGGGLLAEAPQDLAAVLGFVLDDFSDGAGLAARLDATLPQGPVMALLDADAFAILARNLVENALKHSPAGTTVAVELTAAGLLRVGNAGPVVPPGAMARLKQPFARGATRAAGSGLGLAIAEAIATGAGARLELLSPAPGQPDGFEARVQLPPPMLSTDAG